MLIYINISLTDHLQVRLHVHADLGIIKTLHDDSLGSMLICINISLTDHLQVRLHVNINKSLLYDVHFGQYTYVIPELLIHTAVWPVYVCHPKVAHSYCSVASILMLC